MAPLGESSSNIEVNIWQRVIQNSILQISQKKFGKI